MTASWVSYRNYSGPVIRGTIPTGPPTTDRALYHVDRAYWLTTRVESGAKFGAVVMYDGTAATCGPDQHIAVYPSELASEDFNAADDQGGLWKLIRRLETVQGNSSFEAATETLFNKLKGCGWYLSQDGFLRYLEDGQVTVKGVKKSVKAGDLVYGAQIRDEFTPIAGQVPKSGPAWDKSAVWCELFHALFAHPDGYKAQIEFGKEHLVARTRRRNLPVYSGEITALRVGPNWSEAIDLACSVYQSHSVNAPAPALTAMKQAGDPTSPEFPRRLLRLLGNNSYGQWDDDLSSGRYQRTRQAAIESKLWSAALFDGPQVIMPKNLLESSNGIV